jgi:hypothetical protein
MAKPPKKPDTLSPIAFKNIASCTDVSSAIRDEYLDTIASAGRDVDQAERLHNLFRADKSLLGPEVRPLAIEGLGNFASLRGLKFFSFGHFNKPGAMKMSYGHFRSTVDAWVGFHENVNKGRKPTTAQNLAAIEIESRSILVKDERYLWLFRNPRTRSYAFEGLLNKWLAKRLGLATRETRLTLSFKAAAVGRLFKPTFLDARWKDLDYWDASGKTRPTRGTPKTLSGLEEVIASPPTFRDIHGKVHKI